MARRKAVSAAASEQPDAVEVARRASREADGAPAELLDGFVAMLAAASQGRPTTTGELRRRRNLGARAAELGIPIRAVIDLYLSATWMAWSSLPGVRTATDADSLRRVGEAVFRAADAATIAVAKGYEEAQRWSVRQEESFRREFVNDLLDGRNLETLAERAERYGLHLATSHVVVVVAGEEPFIDGGPVTRRVESSMRIDSADRELLVTTKDGLLVCVAPDASPVVAKLVERIVDAPGRDASWRVGVGRAQRGPGGVVRSFEEARTALEIGRRLHLPGPVHLASDLLVYQVLGRDSAALADLVEAVLEPLRAARTGPATLLTTLSTYFAVGEVATAAARRLHVGVRTVTYRLGRIEELTGYSLRDPGQRLALQLAVLGARLLDWPEGTRGSSSPRAGSDPRPAGTR
jgi:sugar diacid utilization regulator